MRSIYRQTSNLTRTLTNETIVDHPDVGAAPTSFHSWWLNRWFQGTLGDAIWYIGIIYPLSTLNVTDYWYSRARNVMISPRHVVNIMIPLSKTIKPVNHQCKVEFTVTVYSWMNCLENCHSEGFAIRVYNVADIILIRVPFYDTWYYSIQWNYV